MKKLLLVPLGIIGVILATVFYFLVLKEDENIQTITGTSDFHIEAVQHELCIGPINENQNIKKLDLENKDQLVREQLKDRFGSIKIRKWVLGYYDQTITNVEENGRVIFESNNFGSTQPQLYLYSMEDGEITNLTNGLNDLVDFRLYSIDQVVYAGPSLGGFFAYTVRDLTTGDSVLVLTRNNISWNALPIDKKFPYDPVIMRVSGYDIAVELQHYTYTGFETDDIILYSDEEWFSRWNSHPHGHSILDECLDIRSQEQGSILAPQSSPDAYPG